MSFPRIEGYVFTEKIGSGSYSTVYKAYNKVGGRQTVAIKCIDKGRVKHSGAAVDNLITEIRLLKSLHHPHIVKMHNFTWDDKNIYIIMEYCNGGDLSKYIKRYGRVPEPQVRYFLQQLASALKFLYDKGVVHMDLKPHNLLLARSGERSHTLKVADFGFAQHMDGEWSAGVRGSPLYMAPEMVTGSGSTTGDLWSIGVIMYECLFGAAPYSSSTLQELFDKIQRKEPILMPSNALITPLYRDLLRSLLQHDPAERISYEDFFAHEYLDLEHMPSSENYEKAVSLIKLAVSLDASGDLEQAFPAYTESLRYLVPCVGCETDAVRRAALKAKLTRYMERAEEIKQYLRGSNPDAEMSCAHTDRHIDSGHVEVPAAVLSSSNKDGAQNEQLQDLRDESAHPPAASSRPGVGVGVGGVDKPRGSALRRLFRRLPSLPLIDTNDSSITNPAQNQEKPGKDTSDNDNCRIT